MPIGEFAGAPAAVGGHGPMYATPAYWLYEMSQASLGPARAWADASRLFFKNPASPITHTPFGKSMAAALELFERSTRRYGKPDSGKYFNCLGAAVLPAAAFPAQFRAAAAPAAAARSHRRADVGSLCDAAARHRRRLPAQP
jgi:hypothetical protein